MTGSTGTGTATRPLVSFGLTSLRTYGLVIAIVVVSVFFYLQNPAFAKPVKLYWTVHRHHWLTAPDGAVTVERQ